MNLCFERTIKKEQIANAIKMHIAWQCGSVNFRGAGEKLRIGAFHPQSAHVVANIGPLPLEVLFVENDLVVEAVFEDADVHARFTAFAVDADLEPAHDRLQRDVRRQGLIGVDDHMKVIGHDLEVIDAKLGEEAWDVAQILLDNGSYGGEGESIGGDAAEEDAITRAQREHGDAREIVVVGGEFSAHVWALSAHTQVGAVSYGH